MTWPEAFVYAVIILSVPLTFVGVGWATRDSKEKIIYVERERERPPSQNPLRGDLWTYKETTTRYEPKEKEKK